MAIKEQVQKLKQGTEIWNEWVKQYRIENREYLDEFTEERDPIHFIDLSWAYLGGMNLSEVDLTGADLYMTDFSGANLSKALLYEANIRLTNFHKTDLSHAILQGAILSEVNLFHANLDHLQLSETIFANVDFRSIEGLETVEHHGPSQISIGTIANSKGQIPEVFLRGCGLRDWEVETAKLYRTDLPRDQIIELAYKVIELRSDPFIQFNSCFISYSSKDEDFTSTLYRDLQKSGVRCWFAPENMKVGDRIRNRIDDSILLHDKLLLVLSKTSVNSQWIEQEVETALEKERKQGGDVLFPIRLDNAVMTSKEGWPSLIRNTRHIGDFRSWKNPRNYDKAFARLLSDLRVGA